MKRYKETRRKHPLDEVSGGDIGKAIDAEAELLSKIRLNADYIIVPRCSARGSSRSRSRVCSLRRLLTE